MDSTKIEEFNQNMIHENQFVGKGDIWAAVVADSVNPWGDRLTTFRLHYPRFIHAEFMTHRMFCLDGDSVLEFDLPGGQTKGDYKRIYTLTLSEFADKWFNGDSLGRSLRHRLSNMNIRQLDESTKKIVSCKVKDCFVSGEKEVFQISTDSENVSGSKDHRILTTEGWKTIENLVVGKDHIITRVQGWQGDMYLYGKPELLLSKKSLGMKMTYDLEMDSKYENFIANGVVVHNSRNASSSRAIPVKKMLEQVYDNPAMPIHWGANQAGMQANGECDNMIECCGGQMFDHTEAWTHSAQIAALMANGFSEAGYHKQVANRLLEPYQFMNVVMSTTDIENFFWLRCHDAADPNIEELANVMQSAYDCSSPEELRHGEWHTPYVEHKRGSNGILRYLSEGDIISPEDATKISASCAAQASYRNLDTSLEKALSIYDKLVGMSRLHASPFENVATPFSEHEFSTRRKAFIMMNEEGLDNTDQVMYKGNFRGWSQLRKTFANENVTERQE